MARIGQDLVQQIIEVIRERGGTVVEVDTDGVFFVPPEDVRGAEVERDFTIGLTDAMPEGIRIGFDGRYKKMLSYKKKNYALLTYDGDLKFKGSSLISRSNEPFGRTFVRRAIRRLLDRDIEGCISSIWIRGSASSTALGAGRRQLRPHRNPQNQRRRVRSRGGSRGASTCRYVRACDSARKGDRAARARRRPDFVLHHGRLRQRDRDSSTAHALNSGIQTIPRRPTKTPPTT